MQMCLKTIHAAASDIHKIDFILTAVFSTLRFVHKTGAPALAGLSGHLCVKRRADIGVSAGAIVIAITSKRCRENATRIDGCRVLL